VGQQSPLVPHNSPRPRTRLLLGHDGRGWAESPASPLSTDGSSLPAPMHARVKRWGVQVTAEEYRVVCAELRCDVVAAHTRWLASAHRRLEQLPWLLQASVELRSTARQAMLARLGGPAGLAALVLDLAPVPPPTALQPPLPQSWETTSTLRALICLVVDVLIRPLFDAFAALKEYGWSWAGLVYMLGLEGLILLGVGLVGCFRSGFGAVAFSQWMLMARITLSAPTLLWQFFNEPGSCPPWQPEPLPGQSISSSGGGGWWSNEDVGWNTLALAAGR
jgi:hypothetical protein